MVEVVAKEDVKELLDEIRKRKKETPKEESVKNNIVYEINEFIDNHAYEDTELLNNLEPARMEL